MNINTKCSYTKENGTKERQARKPATINNELIILSRVFTMAVDNSLADFNPCGKVRKLRTDNQRSRYLTDEEEAALIGQLEGLRAHLRPIVVIALGTGMRRGEILSLAWSEVDFARGVVRVRRTKNGRDRELPMRAKVRAALLELRRSRPTTDEQFVFPGKRRGSCLTEIKKSFTSAVRAAGIRDFHFHDLRHTFATRLGDAGYNVTTIAELLGHQTVHMSARYTQATDLTRRQAVEAISDRNGNPRHNSVTNEKQPPLLTAVNS